MENLNLTQLKTNLITCEIFNCELQSQPGYQTIRNKDPHLTLLGHSLYLYIQESRSSIPVITRESYKACLKLHYEACIEIIWMVQDEYHLLKCQFKRSKSHHMIEYVYD